MGTMRAKEYKNKDSNYNIVGSSEYLSSLKKINIFVGANNSGKSRFLRQVFRGTPDDFVFFDDVNKELTEIFEILHPILGDLFYMSNLKSLISLRTGDYVQRFNDFYKTIEAVKRQSSGATPSGGGTIWDFDVASNIKTQMQRLGIYREFTTESSGINRRHIYIPILRGLRHLDLVGDKDRKDDVYKKRTCADYGLNAEENKHGDVFSGLPIYLEIKKMLLGSREDRTLVREFEKFLSAAFFDGKNVTLIPDHDTDTLKINIDDAPIDREIFNVGDGIQSIIISTFQAFKYQNEDVVLCIEEPEMTMHPSAQRVLIETLTAKFPKLQVFLTTHSNHFLDLSYDYPNDVAIFSFQETGVGKFTVKNVGVNVKILDLLGIRNSSVFLSNCVIWTEGVTDRMFLRKLLELTNFGYKEDYHYAFAEYGGSNLENFDFVNSKNGDTKVNIASMSRVNYLVADNDNIESPENKKYIRRQEIKKFLGEDNFFDSHVEIENLIPFKVWVNVIQKILADYPNKKIKFKDNYAAKEVKFNAALENKKIGTVLKTYLLDKTEDGLRYFSSDDVQCLGLDKKEIMGYVTKAVEELALSLADFSITAQNLVTSLGKFVENANNNP